MDVRKVFKHELAHIALERSFQGKEQIPQWLHEGLALYVSREWDFSRVSAMTRAVLTDTLIPLSEITLRFPREINRAALAYAESFYLISFLISEYGSEKFHFLVREYSRGKKFEEAIREIYDLGWYEFEDVWRSYLKVRFSWIPIVTSTTTLWFLLTLVVIYGYVKKRKATRVKFEEWERQEEDLRGGAA
jgi:hypothetical protein